MTIQDSEDSVAASQPIELYEFIGSWKSYRLTSDAELQTFKGQAYSPIAGMKRGDERAGSNNDTTATVQITIPTFSELIADYGFQVTPPKLRVNIWRMYRDLLPFENNYELYWSGPVTNISVKGHNAVLDVPSILTQALGLACPSIYYQTPCNWTLFDPQTCGVSRVLNSVDTTIASVLSGGQVMVLSSYGAFALTDFRGGEVQIASQNERRMIIGVDTGTNEVTFNYPFGRAAVGTPVQITRGCDHSWMGDCKNRYDNTDRFGGHPLIPAINLFSSGV